MVLLSDPRRPGEAAGARGDTRDLGTKKSGKASGGANVDLMTRERGAAREQKKEKKNTKKS